jgi:aryl-alcohol dehydrogenase-like predicted oxidoreductase
MEKRKYGNTDMEVSVLGFGGAEIGFQNATPSEVDKLLGGALDLGLNIIDTAECYNISEELIGKTVAHRRDDYYLFTKCGHTAGLEGEHWDPEMLARSIDRSLKRLNTEYVDVIHLHTCTEEILRQGAVIEVLQKAKEQGKTRYIGYSGDDQAALYAVQTGVFDSLMTSVNIADQQAIDLTLPEALQRGMGVTIKRPVANVAWKTASKPEDKYVQEYWERLQELQYEFLKSDDLDTAVGIALRFALQVPGTHTAIVGTNNPNRWASNAKLTLEGPLSEELYASIRNRWKEVAGADWGGRE